MRSSNIWHPYHSFYSFILHCLRLKLFAGQNLYVPMFLMMSTDSGLNAFLREHPLPLSFRFLLVSSVTASLITPILTIPTCSHLYCLPFHPHFYPPILSPPRFLILTADSKSPSLFLPPPNLLLLHFSSSLWPSLSFSLVNSIPLIYQP